MKELKLDTIFWQYDRAVPMYYGGVYEITETKQHGWRLWLTTDDSQIGIFDTMQEATQEAELHKQLQAITT